MAERNEIEDWAYFTQRAKQELAKASICEDHVAAKAHLDMATEYQKRADELARQSEVFPPSATASPVSL